jgi:type I restriction enzyme, S subunit
MSADGLWPVVNLGEHATVRARIGWKGLQASEYQDKGYIFLATPNIKGPHIDFRNVNFISKRRYIESPELMLQAGDVLLVKDGSTLGISNIVRSLPGPATVNGSIAVLRCSEGLCPAFLHQLTKATAFQKLINDKKSGLGVPHLFQADLKEFEVPLPSLPEQHRIAEILDTLDEAIRKTEQIIAKLQQMKQGLLHDLLTRGIDENGALRDPDRHPEQFKDSPLGWIPRGWEVAAFLTQCRSSAFGPRFPSDLYAHDGALATLRTTDMDDEGNINLSTMPKARIAPGSMSEHVLVPGDLLISRSGTCGIAAVFPGFGLPVVPGAFLIRFRLLRPQFAQFFRRYFNSPIGRPRLERLSVGGVQKNLKGSSVLSLRVPVLPSSEVLAVQQILDNAEQRITVETTDLSKLRTLKHGLMDDLLTGRVRVSVPEEAAA